MGLALGQVNGALHRLSWTPLHSPASLAAEHAQ